MWNKYDYVFIPEAMHLGVSHPGVVLVSDELLSRSGGEPQDFHNALVLRTQMAQQWLGNYITMEWWSDVWISLSMSTYISYLSLKKGGRFADIESFFMTYVARGQLADAQDCTHALAGFANDLDKLEMISNDILLSKGAAVIKQLSFLIGPPKFRKCLQNFLNINAWSFTSLPKFLIAFTNSVDLQPWVDTWLKQGGLNELSVSVKPNKAGKIGQVEIKQRSITPGNSTLRQHAMTVQLFGTDGKVTKTANCTVQGTQKTLMNELRNLPMPHMVVLNSDNQSYVRTDFDKESRSYIAINYRLIQNALTPITRQKIWKNMFENVLDCKMTIWEFVDLVADSITLETNVGVLHQLVEDVTAALGLAPSSQPKNQRYTRFFDLFLPKLTGAKPNTDLEFMKWALFKFAINKSEIRKCVEWVKVGYISFKSLKLTENDIWIILKKFSTLTSEAEELVRANLARTDTALYGELFCRFAYPGNKADSMQFAFNSNETHSDY